MWINRVNKVPETLDAEKTQKMLNRVRKQMSDLKEEMSEKLKNWVKMNRAQEKVYEKSIKQFELAEKSLDGETAEAYKARQKLQDKVSPKLLKTLGWDTKTLRLIEALPDEELALIVGKNEEEIVEFFKLKNIKISEDIAKELKVLKNVDEIRWLTRILKCGTKLRNFIRWVKWMAVVSCLFAWFDIRCYLEWDKEADLVKKVNEVRWEILRDNARVQLIIWLWSILTEVLALAAVCAAWWSVTWPRWTAVWAVVWLLTAVATIWYDELYGNKKEFYAQNRYDFINKKRTEVKQSIVQLFESDRLDMHEWMKKSIKDNRGPKSEINTMEDAWEALIYQEEVEMGGFSYLQWYYSSWENEEIYKKELSEEERKEYEEEKKKMENLIKIRMEYIKQYVKEDKKSKEYNEMKKALLDNKWIEYVEQLLADSKVYAYLKSDNNDAYIQNYKELNVDSYKEAYKQKLSQEYSKEFDIFEKLRKENPSHLQELCKWTIDSKASIEGSFEDEDWDPTYSEQEKTILKRNIDFVVKYNEYLNLWRPIERQITTWVSFNSIDYKYIEQVLLDIDSINKRPIWDKEATMKYLSYDEFNNDNIEAIDSQVSNSVFQNVIYSVAREIHGYTGKNDKLELVNFYTCDWDSTWIYMDGKRKIKDVSWFLGTKDRTVEDPDKFTKEQAYNMIIKEVDLDSPVEAADERLTKEFRERVKKIIDREYGYRENKKDYEKQIIDFIKTNNNWQKWYVEIPENLVIKAKKAWMGDINKFLFRIEGWQIYALCRGDMADTVLHFDDNNIKIKYEALNPLRSELTQQEKELVSYVDDMEKKLNKLRSKQWSIAWIISQHADDLDIPEYLERIMSQKSIEWNNLKKSILYMQPNTAHNYMVNKSKEFFDFFNWMYLWILNRVTNMNHVMWLNSNDMDNSSDFLQAAQFIWFNVASVKNWKLEISKTVNEAIRKHLPDLFNSYKDWDTWKTIKELLMDKDESNQEKWQELAKKIYELCLEQAVLEFDNNWNVTNITTLDFSDSDLNKVKGKIKNWLKWIWFQKKYDEYKSSTGRTQKELKFSIRSVEQAEVDTHKKIDDITQNIINTMKNVDRANRRKDPKFEADIKQNNEWKITWKFSSWWYSEKMIINMDNSKNIKSVTIDWLGITFSNAEEWFRTANLINFIRDNCKSNPRWADAPWPVWHLEYFQWSTGWDLERDVTVDMWPLWILGDFDSPADVDILEVDHLKKYYPTIHKSKKFLDYINKFL